MKEHDGNLESKEVSEKFKEESDTSADKEREEPENSSPQEFFEEPVKKNNRHLEAEILVEKAYVIVKEAEEQMEACKLLLSDDLKEYNEAKEGLNESGLKRSETLLKEIGVTSDAESLIEDSLLFEPKEELEPMVVKDVSSGRFTGFLMALVGGIVTLTAFFYLASVNTDTKFDLTKIPSMETIKNLLSWFSDKVLGSSDVQMGGALLAFTLLIVMWIIYAIRVYTKGKKNIHFALRQLEEAEEYSRQKNNCKEEMDRIDAHINDTIEILKIYRVLLNEQNGKLERILYLEGKREDGSYHPKSLIEIKDTQKLIDHIRALMAVSMSDEGRLSKRSVMLLQRAQEEKEAFIKRFY